MEIQFANQKQVAIADLLWAANTQKEVDAVIRVFGHDAIVVQQMMIAAAFDQVDDVSQAQSILEKF